MLNVEDDALLRRSILHCFFALLTPVDDLVDQSWQKAPFVTFAFLFRRRLHLHVLNLHRLLFHLCFIFRLLCIFLCVFVSIAVEGREGDKRPLDDTEADIVLPDDTGIQAVEIEQKNEIFVESLHRIEHMASLVFLAVDFLLFLSTFLLPELVRNDEPSGDALVHDQILVSLCTLDFK